MDQSLRKFKKEFAHYMDEILLPNGEEIPSWKINTDKKEKIIEIRISFSSKYRNDKEFIERLEEVVKLSLKKADCYYRYYIKYHNEES